MNISDKGIDLIKKYEGCKLEAYKCPAGVLTIGYGHTSPNIYDGQIIDEYQALHLLIKDVEVAEKCVNANVTGNITQGQFDSLVSFAFNLGCASLRNSTLLRELNAGNDMSAAQQFLKWVHAGPKILPGLVARRTEEMRMFLS